MGTYASHALNIATVYERGVMDLAANDLEKTSAVKREAMVSKLHNMQWLKNTSNSTSPVKVKVLCKQRRGHEEDDKIDDKVLAMEDSKADSAKESCEYYLTMDTCIKDLSSDSVTESDTNLCEKDIDTNMLLNAHTLIMQKIEEEGISSVAVQENLITAQLETHIDKEQKHQESISQNINILQDKTQNVGCSNIPESHKVDHDIKESDLTEHSDKNNNDKTMMPDMSKENIPRSLENDKTSMEAKDKDTCIKKANALKTNVKNASNTTLSKCCNDKPFTPIINPKRSLSNLSKSPVTFNDKYGKAERVTNKHVFTKKNSFTKDESIKQHSCFPTKAAENKAKDVVAKPGLSKTDLEKEPNKTADINQSDQKASSSAVSLNKDKTLQVHQRTTAKQCTPKSKGQEFSRSNTSSALNCTFDKSKVPEKTEKATHVSKGSDSTLHESEKKNSDKNVSNDQKPYVANRNTTFFTYKNSTLSRPAKTKSISGNGHASASGRNPLYARNNTTPDKERAGNNEYKAVTKVKRDCLPTNTLSNANTRVEEFGPSNLEADKKQQCEKNRDAQSANTKSTSVHKTDASTPNNENNINSKEDEKPANVEDRAKQVHVTPEQSCKTEKAIDTKTDADQQPTNANNKVDNEEFKPSTDSFSLRLDKSCTEPQTCPMNPHIVKSKDAQQTDANQTKNNPIIWNDLSDPLRRNMSVHSQQTIVQTENHMRQTSMREMDCGRFFDQRLPMNDTTRPSQIPNTFDAAPYEYNVQTSGDNDITTMFNTMNGNRENSNVPLRYMPNVQQRPFTPLSDLSGQSVPASQVSRWNLSLQDDFHMEQFVNATQSPMMHVYSAAAFGQDDFNGAQVPAASCLPAHRLFYTPYMQTWNSQLHYPTPVFHNLPCTSYTILPNVANQSGNYNDVSVSPMSMCMHEQPQHRYIHYVPANSNVAMQMHANPSYMKSMYGCDLNNCAVEARNTVEAVDDGPMRPNRYYKRYQDNSRTTYDVPQYATPASQPISRPQQQQQQPFIPSGVNQYNVYGAPGQKYYKQSAMNFTQPPPNSPKGQKTQDLVSEDNSLEDIPPIISPKEFMTNNVNFSNKTDQFAQRMFKPDFKMRPNNTGYRQPSFQRYNGGFRKNTYQGFPKEYTSSIGVGRGISKANQNTKM